MRPSRRLCKTMALDVTVDLSMKYRLVQFLRSCVNVGDDVIWEPKKNDPTAKTYALVVAVSKPSAV